MNPNQIRAQAYALLPPAANISIEHRSPWERVALANQIALEAATDSAIRRAALHALRGCGNVPRDGGEWLTRWIRHNVEYSMEAPGVEVLQGPLHTLSYRVGDCDDLAILWCAMARSVGIEARFCGVADERDPETMVHAVGYDAGTGKHWELSEDWRWGGNRWQPLRFTTPPGYFTLWWSPEPGDPAGFWSAAAGKNYQRVGQNSMIRQRNPAMLSHRTRNPDKVGVANTSYDVKGNLYSEGGLNTVGGSGSNDFVDVQASDVLGLVGTLWGPRQPPGPSTQPLLETEVPYEAAASGGVPPAVWGVIGIAAAAGLAYVLIRAKG